MDIVLSENRVPENPTITWITKIIPTLRPKNMSIAMGTVESTEPFKLGKKMPCT